MNSTTGLPLDPKTDSPFGFIPTFGVCIAFIVLFSLTSFGHLLQTLKYRTWWWLPTLVTCGVVEVIGWAGRLWGHKNPWTMPPYLMQICCTIFAPSFMTAAMFIIFVRIIRIVGPEYSRLSPKLYTWLFVGVDLIALVIQSIGGGQAASANTPQGAANGAHVMVGGIILQMAAIAVYALTSVEYFWRVHFERPLRARTPATAEATRVAPELPKTSAEGSTSALYYSDKTPAAPVIGRDRLTRDMTKMILGLSIATVLVIVRSVYRTIELLDGWGGPIITNETLFDCLDGVPIFLAMLTLNVFHPGRLIPAAPTPAAERTNLTV
jgi:hypothetical protein